MLYSVHVLDVNGVVPVPHGIAALIVIWVIYRHNTASQNEIKPEVRP
jgi:hypothetical protein